MSLDVEINYPCYTAVYNGGEPCILSDDETPEIRAIPVFTSLELCKTCIQHVGGGGRITFKAPEDLVQYLYQQSKREFKGNRISHVFLNLNTSNGSYKAFPIIEFMEHVRLHDPRTAEKMIAAADLKETFNTFRMDRCQEVVSVIMENWQKKNSFEITIRATESVSGKSLADLLKSYFTIGAADKLTDLPLMDVLVVIDTIKQIGLAHQRHPTPKDGDKISFELRTAFTFAEAAALLAAYPAETPFDKGSHLRIQPHTAEDERDNA